MSKKTKIILGVVIALVFVVCVVLTLFLTGIIGGEKETEDKQYRRYGNSGKTYSVVLDDYVDFRDCTSTSNVKNEDGLELNYQDTYITIQRFPIAGDLEKWTLEDFQKFVDGEGYSSMNQAESSLSIANQAVKESRIYDLSVNAQNTMFYGVLYYFRTDGAFYKALLSGSNKNYIDHYNSFIDDMEFME